MQSQISIVSGESKNLNIINVIDMSSEESQGSEFETISNTEIQNSGRDKIQSTNVSPRNSLPLVEEEVKQSFNSQGNEQSPPKVQAIQEGVIEEEFEMIDKNPRKLSDKNGKNKIYGRKHTISHTQEIRVLWKNHQFSNQSMNEQHLQKMKTVKESLLKMEESCLEKHQILEDFTINNENLNQNQNSLGSEIEGISKNLFKAQKDWDDRVEERKAKLAGYVAQTFMDHMSIKEKSKKMKQLNKSKTDLYGSIEKVDSEIKDIDNNLEQAL